MYGEEEKEEEDKCARSGCILMAGVAFIIWAFGFGAGWNVKAHFNKQEMEHLLDSALKAGAGKYVDDPVVGDQRWVWTVEEEKE